MGCSGAVTQIEPSRMTPAASAAERSTERLMPSGPMAVTAQTGMCGQSRCQTGIRQLHHSQLTACRAKTNGGSGQLCSGAGQRLWAADSFSAAVTEKHLVHRSTLHPDAGRKRLTPGMVQARDKTGCLQDGPQQACRGRLACRARHADKLHLLHRSGQGGTQFLRRGKALRQSLQNSDLPRMESFGQSSFRCL